MTTPLDENLIRQWVLNAPELYAEARRFGGGGDAEMAERLEEFINTHRERLVAFIHQRLD